MARVYVGVGSNIDPERAVGSGLAALEAAFGNLTVSPVYRNPPVGFEGADFLNLVVGFDAGVDVETVVEELHAIEAAHGRRRDLPRFSARTLDLDLLLYADRVLDIPGLRLPREEITRHAFVLRPLADIAADERHPVLGERFADLWARLEPRMNARLIRVSLSPP